MVIFNTKGDSAAVSGKIVAEPKRIDLQNGGFMWTYLVSQGAEKDEKGEIKKDEEGKTVYKPSINVKVFNRDISANKDDHLHADGEFQIREWTSDSGQSGTSYDLIADFISIEKSNTGASQNPKTEMQKVNIDPSKLPF